MRLEVTQRADLAVRALAVLNDRPDRAKSTDLAASLETTAGFIPHVMGPLVRAGGVRSVPGPTGGYEALVDVATLSVLDVVEAVDGPTDSGRCVVADRACAAMTPCALHVAWGQARSELVASLAALSVAELAVTS